MPAVGDTSGAAAAAAAAARAEAARRAAEAARREAERRAEEQRRQAQLAKQRAEAAQQRAKQQQQQAEQARRQAQNAPASQKAQAKAQVQRQERQAEAAQQKAQRAREEWAVQAKQAEDAMRAANTEAAEAGAKRAIYSERQIKNVQPTTQEVADIYNDAGRRRSDFAQELGLSPTTDPKRIQSVLQADREYARLSQNPDTKAILDNYNIDGGEALHDFGQRVAREAKGEEPREDDIPLSELKDGFKNSAVMDVLKGAGAGLSGEDKGMLTDPKFGEAIAEGRSVGRAAQISTGLGPTAREGMERMGIEPKQFEAMDRDQQRAYINAARSLQRDGDYEAAIGHLADAGPRATETINSLAQNLDDSPAADLLRNEDAVRSILKHGNATEIVDTLAANGEDAHLRALEAMGDKVPKPVVDTLAHQPEIAEGLREMDLTVKDLQGAGAATASLLRAAETDVRAERLEHLTGALSANPDLAIKDEVVRNVVETASTMEPDDTFSEIELEVLSDKEMVESLATKKNGEALAQMGAGSFTAGLGQIRGNVPDKLFETIKADSDYVAGIKDRTGVDLTTLDKITGKGLGALSEAKIMELGDPPNTEQSRELLGHLMDAAVGDKALRSELSSSISSMVGDGGRLSNLPDNVKNYVDDPSTVAQLLRTKEGTQALHGLVTGENQGAQAAEALELLGDKAPPELVQSVLDTNEEALSELGFEDPSTIPAAALPHVLRAADVAGTSPTQAAQTIPHLLEAQAAAPENSELTSIITQQAEKAVESDEAPAHYRLLTDSTFVGSLAGNEKALTALAGKDPAAAYQAMKPNELKLAVEVMDDDPDFNENLAEFGLTRGDLLKADPAALPHLLEAASIGESTSFFGEATAPMRDAARTEALAHAVAADPRLATKLSGYLAENLPEGVARDTFANEKLVEQLSKVKNGGVAMAELMAGHPGTALEQLGANVPPELAKNVWERHGEALGGLGLDRETFLKSGAAMGDLVQSLDSQLSPGEQASELASALGKKPTLAAKLAGHLSELGAEMDSAAGEMLEDPKLIEQLASQEGGPQAIAAMARGEWISALSQVQDKDLRAKFVNAAAKDEDFAEGMADLGISAEQLRTAGPRELDRLVNQAAAAEAMNELEQMKADGASPHDVLGKMEDMLSENSSPAFRKTLMNRSGELIQDLAGVLSSEDSDLSDEQIQESMERISEMTELLPEEQQAALVKNFAEGMDPEAIQDNDHFMEQFRHSIEQGGGALFAIKLADEIKGMGYADEADHLHDQISDAMDEVYGEFEDAQKDFQHYQNQVENVLRNTDDPALAQQEVERLKEEYADEIERFDEASETLLSTVNGSSYFANKYEDDDLDGDADETLDNTHRILESAGTALSSPKGQAWLEDNVDAAANGAATFLDDVKQVAEKVDGYTAVADKIATSAAGAMAIKMQSYADAGNIEGARRVADLVERNPGLFGVSAEDAKTYKTVLLAATDDRVAIRQLQTDPQFKAQYQAMLADTQAQFKANGIDPREVNPRAVAGRWLATQSPGQDLPVGGAFKAVGLVASGIGVLQGAKNWDNLSTTQKLSTVWSGAQFGTDGAAVLSLWAARAGEMAAARSTSSAVSAFAKGAKGASTFLTGASDLLGKLGPAGMVLDTALSAQSAIANFKSGEVAHGVVDAVAGAASLGLGAWALLSTSAIAGPVGLIGGVAIAAGAAIAHGIIDGIQDGNSEEEVQEALENAGVNGDLADILSDQTDDRIGVSGVIQRLAAEANISTNELVEHWNEISSDDERLDELDQAVRGSNYDYQTGEEVDTMHSLLDDNDGDASKISPEAIHAMYVKLRQQGLIPSA